MILAAMSLDQLSLEESGNDGPSHWEGEWKCQFEKGFLSKCLTSDILILCPPGRNSPVTLHSMELLPSVPNSDISIWTLSTTLSLYWFLKDLAINCIQFMYLFFLTSFEKIKRHQHCWDYHKQYQDCIVSSLQKGQ